MMKDLQEEYLKLIDEVNESEDEEEYKQSYHFLDGWEQGMSDAGIMLSYVSADLHSIAKYGEDEPMTCGILHRRKWER